MVTVESAGAADDQALGEAIVDSSPPVAVWAPCAVFSFVAVVLVAGTQGGYFPTTWGPAIIGCAALVAVWLVAGARSDAGRFDLALVAALGALAAWIGLSALWSVAPSNSVLELQRAVVILAAVSALLVTARAGTEGYVVAATALAITGVGGYGLQTRLFPTSSDFDPVSGYRLTSPIGYWNGLGILMAVGSIAMVGLMLDRRFRALRAVAAASLVVLLTTLYFTYSRGGWLAIALGLIVLVAVTPNRLATLGEIALVAPFPAVAVALSAQSAALTHETAHLSDAASAGHRLALAVVVLAVLAAATALALPWLERRVTLPGSARRAIGIGLVAALALVLLAGLVKAGGPVDVGRRAVDSFRTARSPTAEVDLNDHLFQLSGSYRADHWSVAWSAYESHPVLGTGAGTFERFWQAYADAPLKVRDAHSLYVEALMELGPIGLVILLVALAVVIVAGIARRRNPTVPTALAVFVAYAAHAGIDWDWELTGVTMAAFFIGSSCVIATRDGRVRRIRPITPIAAATVIVLVAATIGYVGNRALASAQRALDDKRPERALTASARAHRWAPWSPYPLTVRGEALLATGDVSGAAAAFRSAIDRDDGYWRAWLGLAVASDGVARQQAVDRAERLYPRSSEIYETLQLLKRQELRDDTTDSTSP